MSWFRRFLLWATALAVPAWLLAGPYQRFLIGLLAFSLGLHLRSDAPVSTDLAATNVLAIYAAMCLASARSTWAVRLRALAIGLVAMVAVEWLTGFLHLLTAAAGARGARPDAPLMRFLGVLIESPRVVVPPALWLLLLGRRELPGARGLQALPRAGERRPPHHA